VTLDFSAARRRCADELDRKPSETGRPDRAQTQVEPEKQAPPHAAARAVAARAKRATVAGTKLRSEPKMHEQPLSETRQSIKADIVERLPPRTTAAWDPHLNNGTKALAAGRRQIPRAAVRRAPSNVGGHRE